MKQVPNAIRLLTLAVGLSFASAPAMAQHAGHSSHEPDDTTLEKPASTATSSQAGDEAKPQDAVDEQPMDHSMMGHDMQSMDQSTMDHSMMGHDTQPVDHSEMDHGMQSMDHSAMDHDMQSMDHSMMGHGMQSMDPAPADLPADAPPRTPIPPITPEDVAAAFPPALGGHAVHDKAVHYFALLDRLEAVDADDGNGYAWEALGWVGTDIDRLWVRTEGEGADGDLESANVELFYGRAIARWWDAVAGIRHDFGEGPSRTYAAFGVMGLVPYKFEVEATAYVGEAGQTGLNLEAEYETLFTNRLIGQWLVEAEAWGQDDPQRGIGEGLSTVEAGFRLRYEFTRQFAPYIGVTWERGYGDTADLRRAEGENIEDTRIVVGLRTWF